MPSITTSGSPTFNGTSVTIHTSADRIQVPKESLSATTGWVAARVQSSANWNNTVQTTNGNYLFEWGPTVNDRISLYFGSAGQSGGWRLNRTGSGSGAENQNFVAFSSNTSTTVIGQWTASGLQQSFNGSNFTTLTAQTSIPSLGSQSQFDIGRISDRSATAWLDGTILWFLAGTGTLTNANAATIHGFGDTDPSWASIPGSPTILWPAVDSTYSNSAPVSATFLRPVSDITLGDWVPTPSSPTTLYDKLDETTASDTEYITGTTTVEIKFG